MTFDFCVSFWNNSSIYTQKKEYKPGGGGMDGYINCGASSGRGDIRNEDVEYVCE